MKILNFYIFQWNNQDTKFAWVVSISHEQNLHTHSFVLKLENVSVVFMHTKLHQISQFHTGVQICSAIGFTITVNSIVTWNPILNILSCQKSMLVITQNQLITAAVAAELYLFGQKFIDRPESYCATHSKNCIFISQKKLRTIFTLFLHIFTLSGKKKYTSLSILFSFSFFFFNMISLEFSLFCKNTILDQAVIKTEIKK